MSVVKDHRSDIYCDGCADAGASGRAKCMSLSELAEREGIRTLGTGVSPYNGLAKHRTFSLLRVFNDLALSECFQVVQTTSQNHLN